tara:strand:+ start:1001 stop:1882 length:882 start_codon:yes stop_codon:yes gene_type:complete
MGTTANENASQNGDEHTRADCKLKVTKDPQKPMSLQTQLKQKICVLSSLEGSTWSIAAGCKDTIESVLRSLSAKELSKAAFGMASAPSILREEIEALSVQHLEALKAVCSVWPHPDEVVDNPFFASAWLAALRHVGLPQQRPITEAFFLREVHCAFGHDSMTSFSWEELSEKDEQVLSFDTLRSYGHKPLRDSAISASQLEQSPILFLRALRGRAHLLTKDARLWVGKHLQTITSLPSMDAVALLEIAEEIEHPQVTTSTERVLHFLMERIDTPTPELDILLYKVLSTTWKLP